MKGNGAAADVCVVRLCAGSVPVSHTCVSSTILGSVSTYEDTTSNYTALLAIGNFFDNSNASYKTAVIAILLCAAANLPCGGKSGVKTA